MDNEAVQKLALRFDDLICPLQMNVRTRQRLAISGLAPISQLSPQTFIQPLFLQNLLSPTDRVDIYRLHEHEKYAMEYLG